MGDLFHLRSQKLVWKKFEKLHKLTEEVTVYLVDYQIQETETDTCGTFQLYFYKNLFQNSPESKIISGEKLTKNTISKLLDEIFSLHEEVNEKMEAFAEENNIKFS